MSLAKTLTPEKALIFRITHQRNVPWILEHGLHCRSSNIVDSDFVSIGNQDLIDKRASRLVPAHPGGELGDYIPFYFTPYSPMLLNIRTGRGNVKRRRNEEIAILVSSLARLSEHGVRYLITDSHAFLATAQFSTNLDDLREWLPWEHLQERNFKRDPDDPTAFERYQAEALAHKEVPTEALLGVVCYTEGVRSNLEAERVKRRVDLKVLTKPDWYFP